MRPVGLLRIVVVNTFFKVKLTSFESGTNRPFLLAAFLPSSTTSVTIPAGTLLPGTSYIWDVDFDSRIQSTDINGSGIPTQQLFDVRTFGTFTTLTTPEPASLALLAPVTAFFLLTLKRRRSKKTAGV